MWCILLTAVFYFNAYAASVGQDTIGQSNIIGGFPIDITQVPYQVALLSNGSLWCGGSILTKKNVLSAAHCVLKNNGNLVIHAGSTYWAKPASIHHIEAFYTYGDMDAPDVAVLYVVEQFNFDARHRPIMLFPYATTMIQEGAMATISGWGTTGGDLFSDKLMAVYVPIVDTQSCNASYEGIVTAGEMCAGNPGKDSCQGDSGGPLVLGGKQIGIVSSGYGCGLPNFPGIYADLSYSRDWIIMHITPSNNH